MKNLLKYELYRLWYSHTLLYAMLICIPLAIISQLVIAGNPQSPAIYGMAFEFFVPQMLVIVVPTLFIAREQKKGIIKTSLLCGQNRIKVFFAKTLIYYFAIFIVFLFYILLLTFINAKGLHIQVIDNENSIIYFLRCTSIGLSYCIMLSTILLTVSIIFKNSTITVVSGIILFCINFFMQATVDWRIADKIVPSAMIEKLMMKTNDMAIMINFILMIILTTTITYIVSFIVFFKRNYK